MREGIPPFRRQGAPAQAAEAHARALSRVCRRTDPGPGSPHRGLRARARAPRRAALRGPAALATRFRRGAQTGAQAGGARPPPRRDVRQTGAAPLRGVHTRGQALGRGPGTTHRGSRPIALCEAACAGGPAPFRLRRGFRRSRRKKKGGHLSPRHATRVFLSLATLAGLVLSPGAARAAGGELKAWGGGATPSLALRDLQGKEHKLADYRGKVVVINFWATWCDPCREEMPSMQRLQDKLAGKPFAILAVDFGEGAPRINEFLKKVPVRFTVLLDRDTSAATAWKVKVLPTTLVLDPEQRIRYSVTGDLEWDSQSVEDTIKKLLPPS
ncbi:MAG: TlpA family protein disulfide reductase [Methanobacteriota archaeon]|nr:MAG: TlpA family protein disulfide reductase [Euryarchaeota archaeon]